MNDHADKHAPTDEFVEYLARDTIRRLRHEARFAPTPSVRHSRSRLTSFAIAAGVVLTLSTGMVLGASANYASAEVLPNGTTTIPSRPTLAILPIKNALAAIGCTQTMAQPAAHAAATTTSSSPPTPAPTPTEVAVAAPIAEAVVIDQAAASAVNQNPDRALITQLARQHQTAVVRGDTVSDYIVMVLDASQNYVWSTHGNGNISIEVGGDTRKAAERAEYNRQFATELFGNAQPNKFFAKLSSGDSVRAKRARVTLDSFAKGRAQFYRFSTAADSMQIKLRLRNVQVAGGGRGGVASEVDSLALKRRIRVIPRDSNGLLWSGFVFSVHTRCEDSSFGRGWIRSANAVDSVPNTYTNGWTDARHGQRCNQASGLQERGTGESGIVGLASANLAKADLYTFAAGELATRDLKVMVVHLTAGTLWNGR